MEIKVPVVLACVNAADIPPPPRTAMPEPTADIVRKAAGAATDVDALQSQNDQLRAALTVCAKAGGM